MHTTGRLLWGDYLMYIMMVFRKIQFLSHTVAIFKSSLSWRNKILEKPPYYYSKLSMLNVDLIVGALWMWISKLCDVIDRMYSYILNLNVTRKMSYLKFTFIINVPSIMPARRKLLCTESNLTVTPCRHNNPHIYCNIFKPWVF